MKYGKGEVWKRPPLASAPQPRQEPAGRRLGAEAHGRTDLGEERTDCKPPSPVLMGKNSCKAFRKLLGQHGHGKQPEHQAGMEGVSCQQTLGGCVFV